MDNFKRYFLAFTLSTAGVFCLTAPASAHVLITDTSGEVGAILHIMPDDSPVANKPSDILFHIQRDDFFKKDFTAQLDIIDASGEEQTVPISPSGSSLSADYVFPAAGVYTFVLHTTSNSKSYTFEYSQRVLGQTPTSTSYLWAEMIIIFSLIGFFALAIFAFNNRKEIYLSSTF